MDNVAKLRWQCRRGTLELDLLLMRYLEQCYPSASDAEQQQFAQLLEFEDDVLIQVFLGNDVNCELVVPDYQVLVRKIRS